MFLNLSKLWKLCWMKVGACLCKHHKLCLFIFAVRQVGDCECEVCVRKRETVEAMTNSSSSDVEASQEEGNSGRAIQKGICCAWYQS